MNCPICDQYGKTYASKPLGAVKIRYRKCDGCGNRFRIFEEIDASPVVRGHQKMPRFPLIDADNIACPDYKNAGFRHKQKTTKGDIVTHFYACNGCNSKFGIEADSCDPITAVRKKAVSKVGVICPLCDGPTIIKARTKAKSGETIRRECKAYQHRFTYRMRLK